jgi:hypothetical protein
VFLAKPLILFCDNINTTYLVATLILHAHTKLIEVNYHFVREHAARGALHVQFIGSDNQIVDGFTKTLSSSQFSWFRNKLNMSVSRCHSHVSNKKIIPIIETIKEMRVSHISLIAAKQSHDNYKTIP